MDTNCQRLSYKSTGFFSKMVNDYVEGNEQLQPFYQHPVHLDGVEAAISQRQKFETNRQLLVDCLTEQYSGINLTGLQQQHLGNLLLSNTFTVTTAHQPNIFTGPLYFIYKILHAIKLASELGRQFTQYNFVPVYYMGSEDADLDELGHIYLEGNKLEWKTDQTGAIGRMLVDDQLISLIDIIAGRVGVLPFGAELTAIIRSAYTKGATIQQASLAMVNSLFAEWGLLVLIPDNPQLKAGFVPVIKKELTAQFSHPLVAATGKALSVDYKMQATGREINLFYLAEQTRERIEKENGQFVVKNKGLSWSEDAMLALVDSQPECFSPNVILRGVFQETVLPNIAFIGGGGEIAYWLELKEVFKACDVPFPVLVVRNSFLLFDDQQTTLAAKLGFTWTELFCDEKSLIDRLVISNSQHQLTLSREMEDLKVFYEKLQLTASAIDRSLNGHVAALQAQALKTIKKLERKMLRAEKRKFDTQQRQIHLLKQQLFPGGNLQERVENFSLFYAKYGTAWLRLLYNHSLALEQKFTLLQTKRAD